MHTFHITISERQLNNVHKVVDSHIKALKNWIASRVESGDLEDAQKLTVELREYEAIFAASNVQAKLDIAKHSNKPVETNLIVCARSR